MTNKEIIQTMTTEELAEYIHHVFVAGRVYEQVHKGYTHNYDELIGWLNTDKTSKENKNDD